MENQTTPPVVPQNSPPQSEDKTAAIISYLTLLGFFVAIFVHNSKKTKLGAFHLRQMLGFFLTAVVVGFSQIILLFIPILGWLAILGLWISMLVLWIMGLISAVNGQMKPMPVMGPLYQKWFSNTFD
ncbi:MAG: DUF4870 domain-containing protein [Verrucomicrobiota bacterium]